MTHLLPRIATSRQWTELPRDLSAKIQKVFTDQFKKEAAGGEFVVEGRFYPDEIVLRLGFLEQGRLKQVNFEASMDLPQSDALTPHLVPDSPETTTDTLAAKPSAQGGVMERLYICMDALGSMMEEFFTLESESDIDVPLYWTAYDFEGSKVYMQHSTTNSRLEAEADRLLGLATDGGLLNENEASEDALAQAEIDSDLAFEIQKAIRAGTYPRPADGSELDSN